MASDSNETRSAAAVVLAAGKGTRMGSDRAKVLHELGGRPLLAYPIERALAVGVEQIVVVVGHQREAVVTAVREAFPARAKSIGFAVQGQQRGTGHAVSCALPSLRAVSGPVLILSGDVPMVTEESLWQLIEACHASSAGLVASSFRPEDPTGYGRMVRGEDGGLEAIVEHADADEAQRAIGECNAGMYCVMADHLREDLPRIGSDNAQGEVYLTDLIALGCARGRVACIELPPIEAAGVNTPEQLTALELVALDSPRSTVS